MPKKFDERGGEQEMLRRKRSEKLPNIPDFSIRLARGEIQNLVNRGRFPVESHLKEYLLRFYSREEIQQILKNPKVRRDLTRARAGSQIQMFEAE